MTHAVDRIRGILRTFESPITGADDDYTAGLAHGLEMALYVLGERPDPPHPRRKPRSCDDLLDGARQRHWTEAQLAYFASCLHIATARARTST